MSPRRGLKPRRTDQLVVGRNVTKKNENTNNGVVFSFWSVLMLLLDNDKNDVFSFLFRSGAVTGREGCLLL
jgi:hypothetical protein